MTVGRWRKKPVVIEAVQYNPPDNCQEVWDFLDWEWEIDHQPDCDNKTPCYIPTLVGLMEAAPGDWIIKGTKGELYRCQPDIFDAIYEPDRG